MMRQMRSTSLDAFNEIKPELGDRQKIVLDAIKKLGCPTDLEIACYLGHSDPNKVRPRRNELMKAGIITECEKRECSISHRTVFSWRII